MHIYIHTWVYTHTYVCYREGTKINKGLLKTTSFIHFHPSRNYGWIGTIWVTNYSKRLYHFIQLNSAFIWGRKEFIHLSIFIDKHANETIFEPKKPFLSKLFSGTIFLIKNTLLLNFLWKNHVNDENTEEDIF